MFMSIFLTADACLSWSLPSITEQQVYPHRLPMQYLLKNQWPDVDQAFFKHSPHTQANCTSNSAILRNNYILLLSDFCTCIHEKKKWCHKGSHSSSVSVSNHLVRLQIGKKRWAGALLSGNAAVLCENHRERVMQIWTSPSEEEEEERKKEKHFGRLATF